MAKVYLEPGQAVDLCSASIRIGASGTIVDVQVDWTLTAIRCDQSPERDNGGSNAIGQIVDKKNKTFSVFLELETGRLWFDDEDGY